MLLKVSDGFKKAIQSTERVLSVKLVFDNKTFLGNEVKSIELNDDILGSGSDFKIGTFITTKGKVEIISTGVPNTLEGKECNLYIGVQLVDGTIEYVNMGIFKVIDETVKGQIITLELEDRTNRFDIPYVAKITWPCTLKAIVNDVCRQVGITLNGDFFNSDYIVKNDPVLEEDVTCRKVIIAVAELMGGYARINSSGKLEFFNLTLVQQGYISAGDSTYYVEDGLLDGTVGTIDLSRHNYFEFENSKNPMEYLSKVSVMFNNIYVSSGNDKGKNYVISENILINSVENQELCDKLYEKLNGLEYKPMSLKWIGNPAYQCGDLIEIYDGNVFHKNYIMTRKLSFNGGLTETYSSSGFSKEKDKTQVQGTVRQKIEKAHMQIEILDDKFTLKIKDVNKNIETQVEILDNKISTKVGNKEFGTYVEQTQEQISSKVTAEEAGTYIVQNADSLNISVNGKLEGKTYTFDGNGFILGGSNGDVVRHTNNGSQYDFQDGSKAIINSEGFYNVIGTTRNEYHHLSKVYRMTPTTSNKFTMTLPDEFKGKKFYLAPSISILNKPAESGEWRLTYFEIQAEPLSYADGTVQIWCYAMWSNGSAMKITIPTMTLLVIA